jgi:hypothetical protein
VVCPAEVSATLWAKYAHCGNVLVGVPEVGVPGGGGGVTAIVFEIDFESKPALAAFVTVKVQSPDPIGVIVAFDIEQILWLPESIVIVTAPVPPPLVVR